MDYLGSLFDVLKTLTHGLPVKSPHRPLTFEELESYAGFVLYETKVTLNFATPTAALLKAVTHDRGYVFVNKVNTAGNY